MTFEMGKDWTDSLKHSLWEVGEELKRQCEDKEESSEKKNRAEKKHEDEEIRITDEETGAQKGTKLEQLGYVDPQSLSEVGKVAGYGAKKYEKYNFLKGYDWSLSYNAMQRHLNAFWAGEDDDPESGLSHLAHAVFHGLALISFQRLHPNKDDRPHKLI